jgi:uncharacterized membrane protein YfcA
MPIVALLLVGLGAGVLSGMFGIGGGIVIVPALTMLLGFGLNEATGTSLAALLMPVGIFACTAYWRAGLLSIRTATPIAVGLIGGGILGAYIALGLDQKLLQQLYGLFLLWTGWRLAEPRKLYAAYRAGLRGAAPTPAQAQAASKANLWVLLGVGLAAGILSGMFGIGGGIVIVAALVVFLKLDQKIAVGTSLASMLLPVGLGSVIAYYQAGELDVGVAVPVAIGLIFGSFGGAKIAIGLPSATVKRLYGVFLILISFRFLGVFDWLMSALGS